MDGKDLDDYLGDLMPVGFFRIDKPIEKDILKDFEKDRNSKFIPMKAMMDFDPDTGAFDRVYIFK